MNKQTKTIGSILLLWLLGGIAAKTIFAGDAALGLLVTLCFFGSVGTGALAPEVLGGPGTAAKHRGKTALLILLLWGLGSAIANTICGYAADAGMGLLFVLCFYGSMLTGLLLGRAGLFS